MAVRGDHEGVRLGHDARHCSPLLAERLDAEHSIGRAQAQAVALRGSRAARVRAADSERPGEPAQSTPPERAGVDPD